MEPVEKDKPVLVAGDPELQNMKKNLEMDGIPYHKNQIKYAVSAK
jgi:hypothetical protein